MDVRMGVNRVRTDAGTIGGFGRYSEPGVKLHIVL